jgi:hypothetical protein
MQAMNGSNASFRSRGRLIGCCMALALALSALVFAPSAGAVTHPVKTYLALGDSLAFGYTQVKHTENAPGDSPAFFEEGYSHFYAKKVRANKAVLEDNKGMVEVNDGCPGETTLSFLGEGVGSPLGKNCAYQAYFTLVGPGGPGGPLHNPYPGKSQESNMLQILKGGAPAHPITAITLDIGANDQLAAIAACKAEVKGEYETTGKAKQPKGPGEQTYEPAEAAGAINACVAGSAPATFFAINAKIETILEKIYVGGGYTGKTVVLGFYNPDTFLLPGSDALQKLFNEFLEGNAIANYAAKGVVFANPLELFNGKVEKTAAEQKKICLLTEMCNATAQAENLVKWEAQKTKEEGEGKTVIFPFNPAEGDIHPTVKGAETLAKALFTAAPL